LNETYFATGAMKEIKVWKLFECIHVIPNAHTNSILSLKMFKIFNPSERKTEEVLASGGKDKQLKLWNITNIMQGVNPSEAISGAVVS
jgi:WD40 repeat protein